MTSSDDDLRWVLRRELNAEAARLSAAQDGLSQIRARLGSQPAIPLWGPLRGGLRVDAERYGLRARHLAAEAADWVMAQARRIPFRPGRDRGRRDQAGSRTGARPGIVWLRPVLALAAVCIFAGTAAAVPGVRHAITTIGSAGSGENTSVNGPGGGGGGGGAGPAGPGGRQGNGTPPGRGGGPSPTPSPSPTSTCKPAAKTVPSARPS